jgi:hypothetical protein
VELGLRRVSGFAGIVGATFFVGDVDKNAGFGFVGDRGADKLGLVTG